MRLWITALAASLIGALSVEAAESATTDPLLHIYDISGVRDTGGSFGVGVATSMHCTNYRAEDNNIRIIIRNRLGTLVKDSIFLVRGLRTFTVSTKSTTLFEENASLNTGALAQGHAVILATSRNVVCSAMIVDAGSGVPNGIALHLRRFNPLAGTQE